MLARRRISVPAVVLGCSLLGCAAPVDEAWPDGRVLGAISGGEQDSIHHSVFGTVALKNGEPASCTATLVAPNLLVTARHCISEVPSDEVVCGNSAFGDPIEPDDFIATNSPFLETSRVWFEAARIDVPQEGNDTCGFDIALVTLAANVPASAATPTVPRIDRDVTLGEEYTAVGYGIDERGRSQGRTVLSGLEVTCEPGKCGIGVRITEFGGSSGICEGDSGGPALDLDGKLVGVVSRGGSGCSHPIYGAVSAWRQFIQSVALEAAEAGDYAPPFWATTGQSDPPPPGSEPDPPTTDPEPIPPGTEPPPPPGVQGDPCSNGAECSTGFGCYQANSSSIPFCVRRCSADEDCPGTLSCNSVGDGAGEANVCLERRADPSGAAGSPGDEADVTYRSTSEASCSMAPARGSSGPRGFVAALVAALVLGWRRKR